MEDLPPKLLEEIAASPETIAREETSSVIDEGDVPWWLAHRSTNSENDERRGPKSGDQPTWKQKIPGRGHSSPTVVGNRVFLSAADEKSSPPTQFVIALDRTTGEILWKTMIHSDGLPSAKVMHLDASHASPTIAVSNDVLCAVFLNSHQIQASLLGLKEGRILRSVPVGPFSPYMGYAPSPAVWGDRFIISADDGDGGFLAAIDQSTGEILWRRSRPPGASHSSPTIMAIGGEDQIVLSGLGFTAGYAPRDGVERWRFDGPADTTVSTGVTDGTRVFVSGGYPQQGVVAASVTQLEGKWHAEVIWQDKAKVYVPSLLLTEAGILGIAEGGIANLWASDTGKLRHRLRLGEDFYATPIQIGQEIYVISKTGKMSILQMSQNRLREVDSIQLEGQVLATPTAAGSSLIIRTSLTDSKTSQDEVIHFRVTN